VLLSVSMNQAWLTLQMGKLLRAFLFPFFLSVCLQGSSFLSFPLPPFFPRLPILHILQLYHYLSSICGDRKTLTASHTAVKLLWYVDLTLSRDLYPIGFTFWDLCSPFYLVALTGRRGVVSKARMNLDLSVKENFKCDDSWLLVLSTLVPSHRPRDTFGGCAESTLY
jgi:hypothetical protein